MTAPKDAFCFTVDLSEWDAPGKLGFSANQVREMMARDKTTDPAAWVKMLIVREYWSRNRVARDSKRSKGQWDFS